MNTVSANYTWSLAWASPASAEFCFTDSSTVTCSYFCSGGYGIYHYYTINDDYLIDCDLNVVCTSCCDVSAWEWDWDDGTTFGNTETACHVFLAPDVYTVKLTAYAVSGGYDTINQVLSILPPNVNFDYTVQLPNSSIVVGG